MALIDDQIAEAQAALHKLQTGSMREEIRYADGKAVRFVPPDIQKLKAYILELQIEKAGGRQRGAVGVYF
jgi:hypothetical protein